MRGNTDELRLVTAAERELTGPACLGIAPGPMVVTCAGCCLSLVPKAHPRSEGGMARTAWLPTLADLTIPEYQRGMHSGAVEDD